MQFVKATSLQGETVAINPLLVRCILKDERSNTNNTSVVYINGAVGFVSEDLDTMFSRLNVGLNSTY